MQIDWTSLAQIPVWENVDATIFREQIAVRGQPAVLKNYGGDWPAVREAKKSPAKLCEYIGAFDPTHPVNAFFGQAEIKGRYFYRDDFKSFNFERRQLALGELLEALLRHENDDAPPCFYAGAIPLRGKLASIIDDNKLGLLDSATEKLISIWIGNKGRTAAHWDLPQNIACVIGGHRRFTLFPPDQLANLYVGPMELTPAGQPISIVDFHAPDFKRFPRFKEALANAQVAELGPGDALYIPSLWFHHVECLDSIGMLINYWWRDAAPHMFTPRLTLLHALLSIRDMPANERAAWKVMFDHYIFDTDQEPMAHIPEDARGFFGPRTPETIARMRAALLHSMGGQPRK